MVLRKHQAPWLGAFALAIAACGGGSNVSNASPRISSVPQQSTTGDTAFTLDLADYVTDREATTLTYAVTSGGGAFAGSTYSNTFDTMGTYEVEFTVTDGAKTTAGSFEVKVTEANLVVVREDSSGLLLLDSRTDATVRVAAASSSPAFQTGLADGRLVYSLAGPSGNNLFVFDPLTRQTVELAPSENGGVVYQAKTSDGRVVFTAGTSVESTLYICNPRTGLSRPIAVGNLPEVVVNVDDLVFYEALVNGQTDVFLYDPDEDEATAVADEAVAERIEGVLPNGGVVISRVGAGGETDLFYYRRSVGFVEIGADVSAIATMDKSFHDSASDSKVVFTAASGAVQDLHVWNPQDGQTTSLSAVFGAGAFDQFVALGDLNEVVWNRVVSGTEADAYFYDLDAGTSGTVRNAADVSTVLGVSGDGSTTWVFVRPSGTTSSVLAVSLVASPTTVTWAAGGAVSATIGTLGNGDVVAQRTDGAALAVFDVSAGTWGTPITGPGTGLAFAGAGLDVGDFVFTSTVSAQTDLTMWDASAGNTVIVSDTTGDDVFQLATDDATILFTRVVSGNTNADLFVWNGTATVRLTEADVASLLHDHTVLGKYAGTR